MPISLYVFKKKFHQNLKSDQLWNTTTILSIYIVGRNQISLIALKIKPDTSPLDSDSSDLSNVQILSPYKQNDRPRLCIQN